MTVIVVLQVFSHSTHLNYALHLTLIQQQPDRPVHVHLPASFVFTHLYATGVCLRVFSSLMFVQMVEV